MRALLILNPHATATTERRRELLTRALAGSLALTIAHTEYRGHATELAAAARADGTSLVVVYGGDGTVNEAVNGLLRSRGANNESGRSASSTPVQSRAAHSGAAQSNTPLLAVVPGGSTNVFARAVGIDRDPTTATEQILNGLARGSTRVVSVGLADDRYFTFNAGLGLDAEVVKAIEDYRAQGRRISNSLHIRRAIRAFFASDRKNPQLTVTVDGRDLGAAHVALISNVDPWTYAGSRAVHTNPELAADRDLGLLALRSMRTITTLRILRQLLARRRGPASTTIMREDRAQEIVITAARPIALQVDGDYVDERLKVRFTSVPSALRVVV
ncbi:MAG: diacylglycerol kinase family protein [Nakamurella sp.]